jgi:hypothetical protein
MNREKFTSTFAKLILVAVSMSSMLALGTQTATAQAIIVTTPFAFSVGSQSYPAGTYQFTRLSEWFLSIRNVKVGGERFFAVRPEEKVPLRSHGGLTLATPKAIRIFKQSTCRARTALPSCINMTHEARGRNLTCRWHRQGRLLKKLPPKSKMRLADENVTTVYRHIG